MNHISQYFTKYQAPRAFYNGHEIAQIINYLASGRVQIIDNTGIERIINRDQLIII